MIKEFQTTQAVIMWQNQKSTTLHINPSKQLHINLPAHCCTLPTTKQHPTRNQQAKTNKQPTKTANHATNNQILLTKDKPTSTATQPTT